MVEPDFDQALAAVPHRHYVLAIPRMLRSYFQRHRALLKKLCALAQGSIAQTTSGEPIRTPHLRTLRRCGRDA